MSNVEIWLVIIGLTLVTILMRSSFLMLGDYVPLPERVQHGLRYAPVCALVALITPELFVTQAHLICRSPTRSWWGVWLRLRSH